MQDLVEKVWNNANFHIALREVELAWLRREVLSQKSEIGFDRATRVMRAAAILACSTVQSHRRAAFRAATCTYELLGTERLPFDQALRVVLARLGNFPSFSTRAEIASAGSLLPMSLAAEEAASSESRKVIVNDGVLYLTDFQHGLWHSLVAKLSVAMAAPTSAGKSFILQNYLASDFDQQGDSSIVYIVPTRALIAQVAEDLMEHFSSFKGSRPEIVTVPLEAEIELPARAIFVMTQERVQLTLSSHPKFSPNLIVVDEAHSITEGSRGVVLQWVIDDMLRRSPTAQILFASPLIRNLDVFGRLFAREEIVQFPSVEPTVSQNFILVDVVGAKKGKIELRSAGEGQTEPVGIASIELGETLASRVEKLVHIPARLGENQSNIVYANGPAEAEKVALQLYDLRADDEEITEYRAALAELAEEAVHPNYALVECVKRGVAFHYSNMPAQLRRAVEEAASEGHIDFLACTSTLLQGVNLPAKNIFMTAPEKGKNHPLASTDFWNLSGRAGRLRREFHGNIFLIDYSSWKTKPLEGPKDSVIVPAIQTTVIEDGPNLVNVITDAAVEKGSDEDALETAFVRLYADHKKGELTTTMKKLGVEADSAEFVSISSALMTAEQKVTLPVDIIKRTPNVSAHKQQRLFDEIRTTIETGRDGALSLIPAHPREGDAFNSYATILEACHRVILGQDTSKGRHRFLALMALRWMRGLPLPQIIGEQLTRKPDRNQQTVIRETLDVIEKEIRFQAVRLIGCYNALLVYGLDTGGLVDLASSIPSIPLYLEIGASDRTMISFISLGLSRVAAMKLNDMAARKDMDVPAALRWLSSRPFANLGLSPLLLREVQLVLDSAATVAA